MFLSSRTVAKLKRCVKPYVAKADIPKQDAWKRLSDDDIWRHFVNQVAVVGSAAGGERIDRLLRERKALGFRKLVQLPAGRRRRLINKALRESGVRYASEDVKKCRKTAAIARNLEFLSEFPGGPSGYLRSLAGLRDDDARIARVAQDLSYVKLKGARDLLIGLGVATSVVALDTRILDLLRRAGASIPKDVRTNPESYRQLEKELLNKICKPLRITGAALDRILFQHYKTLRLTCAASRSSPAHADCRNRASFWRRSAH